MAIVNYSPAQGLAELGQGLGNAIAQYKYGLPQQRMEMAMKLAELRQMQQYHQGLMGLQNNRLQDQSQYHEGLLGLRGQGLDQQEQQNQILDAIRQIRAGTGQQNADTHSRQVDDQGQHWNNMDARPMNLGGGNYLTRDSQGQNDWLGNVQLNPLAQGQQSTPPGNGWQMNQAPRAFAPANPNVAIRNQLEANKQIAMFANTNTASGAPDPYGQNRTNAMQILQSLMQGGQQQGLQAPQRPMPQTNSPRTFNYNPSTGQLE